MDETTQEATAMPEEVPALAAPATAMPEEVTGQVTAPTAPPVLRGFSAHKAAGKLSTLTPQELQVAEKIWGRDNLKKDKVAIDTRVSKGIVSGAMDKLEKLGYLSGVGSHKSSTYNWNPAKK